MTRDEMTELDKEMCLYLVSRWEEQIVITETVIKEWDKYAKLYFKTHILAIISVRLNVAVVAYICLVLR